MASKKTCPKCAEKILAAATRCKHCGYEYDPQELEAQRRMEAATMRRGSIGCIVILIAGSLIFAIGHCSSSSDTPEGVASQATADSNPLGLAPLKTANRFDEYKTGDLLWPAQQALNAGNVGTAYNLFAARDQTKDGPRERRFDAAIEQALKQWDQDDPAADFADRIKTYWQPEAAALPQTAPEGEEYGKLLTKINGLAINLGDGENLTLNTRQREMRNQFEAMLSAKQSKLFPQLRRLYGEKLRAGLFRDNVDVKVSGPASQTISLTGPTFANNANIEDMEASLASDVSELRFQHVQYHWTPSAPGYRYDLKSPADRAIGYWEGSIFKKTGRH